MEYHKTNLKINRTLITFKITSMFFVSWYLARHKLRKFIASLYNWTYENTQRF